MSHPLIQTKLHRPINYTRLVNRPRLFEKLNRGLEGQLILVSAPAGFGKTTLVSAWLERLAENKETGQDLPVAWLSLEESDNDLIVFLRYFVAALNIIFPGSFTGTSILLDSRQSIPFDEIAATLINEIDHLPRSFLFILDDYDRIHNRDVQNLISQLFQHWPHLLHLVLITRRDPPFPLTVMRASGKLSEIRSSDLRFNQEETDAFLELMVDRPLHQKDRQVLYSNTEGWAVGLRLAALSLQSRGNYEDMLSRIDSPGIDTYSYLMDEVLSRQLPVVRNFLIKTSILNRFNVDLCEAIIDENDPTWTTSACLNWVDRADLFIVHLDQKNEWYRYHHLFQDMLLKRLTAETMSEQVSDLHRRASAWFEEQGLIDEALHHALGAGDRSLATHLIGKGLHAVVDREDRPTLERWMSILPEETIQKDPWLLLLRVWVYQLKWQLDKQFRVLQDLQELLEKLEGVSLPARELHIFQGHIAAFRGQQAYLSGHPASAITLFTEAREKLPPSWTYLYGGAMHYLGMSLQASGKLPEAERLLLEEYGAQAEKTSSYPLRLLLGLCFIYYLTGQFENARQVAQILHQGSIQSKLAILQGWAESFLGRVHYEWNDMDLAARHFSWIVENRYSAQISVYRDAVAALAMIHQFRGEQAEAWRMVETISQFDLEQRGVEDPRTRSLRAGLMLLQGDIDIAGNWADTLPVSPPDRALLWWDEPELTQAQILVARGKNSDVELALQILDGLDDIANQTHNTFYKIRIQVIRVLALNRQGKASAARSLLGQVLELARPGGFVRVFVDEGQVMKEMLEDLARQGILSGEIQRILAAFPPEDIGKSRGGLVSRSQPQAGGLLSEPLTAREYDILLLLQQRLSYKEIGQKLNISANTVKRHTSNLYAKLDVGTRQGAVSKAISLRILPDA